MKLVQFIFILLLSIVIAAGFAIYVMAHRVTLVRPVVPIETTYQRVMRTHTLRCGYGFWAPGLMKDERTGQLNGIFHDYVEALGRRTGLTIEWLPAPDLANYNAMLNSGQVDAMCFGASPEATNAQGLLFTRPIYDLPVHAYVRRGDTRFDHSINRADAPNVVIAAMDGDPSGELVRSRFPLAHLLNLPAKSDEGLSLLYVAAGKADLAFADTRHGEAFMLANPGRITALPLDQPLKIYSYAIPVADNDPQLADLLNTVTDALRRDGEITGIVQKYVPQPGVLLPPAPGQR